MTRATSGEPRGGSLQQQSLLGASYNLQKLTLRCFQGTVESHAFASS